jgi:ubiquinone/menaquinone biosynthesis C-methylase UbiE
MEKVKVFDKYFEQYEEWFEINKLVYLSELVSLEEVVPENELGLEVGVGSGRFAACLGIKVGIDPAKNMLKLARIRGVDVFLALGEKLPFKDESFDYAAIIVTICFVDDPNVVLEEAKRVLKLNGMLIVGIIDKESKWGELYSTKKEKSKFYKVAIFYSAKELWRLLTAIGFKNLKAYQILFQPPDSFKKIEKPRKGYGKGGFVVMTCNK